MKASDLKVGKKYQVKYRGRSKWQHFTGPGIYIGLEDEMEPGRFYYLFDIKCNREYNEYSGCWFPLSSIYTKEDLKRLSKFKSKKTKQLAKDILDI